MICSVCKHREVPTGPSDFYMEANKMCLNCFIFFCDCGLFYAEGLSQEEECNAITAWLEYEKEASSG